MTPHIEHEGLGPNVWRSSPSALCQTIPRAGMISTTEVQPGHSVFLKPAEQPAFEANEREQTGKEDNEVGFVKSKRNVVLVIGSKTLVQG